MLRNYLLAAIHNLSRNRLYAFINIVGLAIALAIALLIAALFRDQTTYDQFFPEHERTYRVVTTLQPSGQTPQASSRSPAALASWLMLDSAAVESAVRGLPRPAQIRRNALEVQDNVYWADADLLNVLPFPALAGDPRAALAEPNGLVLTRKAARRFFQKDAPLGETLEVDGRPMTVRAVLEDYPPDTHFSAQILAAGRTSFSPLTGYDAAPSATPEPQVLTYVRLKPSADRAAFARELSAVVDRHVRTESGTKIEVDPLPIADIRLKAPLSNGALPGHLAALYAICAVGLLILGVASINFINLMTARATRRATEVGVRKSAGATRGDLIVQFIGESIIYVALAMLLAVGLAELVLPYFNAFMSTGAQFDYWRDPFFLVLVLGLTPVVGLLAGAYPALILSSFRPAAVLKGGLTQTAGSGTVRQLLVVFQFAVLIGLSVLTVVIYRQTAFANEQGLRFANERVLLISTRCAPALRDEVAALAGVTGAACSSSAPLNLSAAELVRRPDGAEANVWPTVVGPGFFELYGRQAMAGRLFVADRVGEGGAGGQGTLATVVVNRTAVRALGLSSPAAAIGTSLNWPTRGRSSEIVGVVPDFPIGSAEEPVRPTVFHVDPTQFRYLSVKIRSDAVPEVLPRIDRLWAEFGESPEINRFFLEDRLRQLNLGLTRTAQALAIFAGLTLLIACLGLFGLAAFTAERRTKEIGIRKAMGATEGHIVRMLLWQFTKPVLVANLLAWPLAFFLSSSWLQGFAYRTELTPWIFVGASLVAVLIAWATVAGHAIAVARARPVTALRYE
jgi:putative ABC transport system permease protein